MHVNEPCQSSFFLKLLGNEKKLWKLFFFFGSERRESR